MSKLPKAQWSCSLKKRMMIKTVVSCILRIKWENKYKGPRVSNIYYIPKHLVAVTFPILYVPNALSLFPKLETDIHTSSINPSDFLTSPRKSCGFFLMEKQKRLTMERQNDTGRRNKKNEVSDGQPPALSKSLVSCFLVPESPLAPAQPEERELLGWKTGYKPWESVGLRSFCWTL